MRENQSDVGERELGYRLLNRKVALILAFVFVVVGAAFGATEPAVKKIEIKSVWEGMGPTHRTTVVIWNVKGTYRLGRKRLAPDLVDALVTALREPTLQKPNLINLGMTSNWLKENAASAASMVTVENATPDQKALFQASFTDQGFVTNTLPSVFDWVFLDDEPSASVEVAFEDGSKLSAHSDNSFLMLLPWKVLSDGMTFETYNANISRALAALMPKNPTNRERLAGNNEVYLLARAVMRAVEETQPKRGATRK